MTCIIGVKEKGKVYIGGDSAGVSGIDICVRQDVKVFQNGPFLIGCCGSFRMIQLLQFDFKPPEHPVGHDDLRYMVTSVVPQIQYCFRDGGFLEINNNVLTGGLFLIAYRNTLYTICSDFQVGCNKNQLDAIGCGAYYALGAMEALNKKYKAKERIKKSLQIATKYSGGVRPPFLILEAK
jgi:ATP-dependent protease HslVU (ClpYQ) peptidase subunit